VWLNHTDATLLTFLQFQRLIGLATVSLLVDNVSQTLLDDVMHKRGHTINGPVLRALIAVKADSSPEGFTATDLARAIGVSKPTITNWIKGARAIDADNLAKLVRVFGIEDSRALVTSTISEVEAEAERQRARRNKPVAA